MTAFERALKFTLAWEGGHVSDPDDAGGETYCGISRVAHPDWEGWKYIDADEVKELGMAQDVDALRGMVSDFYRAEYWDKMRCGNMPGIVGIVVFDSGVNCGRKTAVKWLQNVVRVPADGIVGNVTLSALNGTVLSHEVICADILDMRDERYDNIVMRNPVQVKFLRGWKNRTAALRKEVDCG